MLINVANMFPLVAEYSYESLQTLCQLRRLINKPSSRGNGYIVTFLNFFFFFVNYIFRANSGKNFF